METLDLWATDYGIVAGSATDQTKALNALFANAASLAVLPENADRRVTVRLATKDGTPLEVVANGMLFVSGQFDIQGAGPDKSRIVLNRMLTTQEDEPPWWVHIGIEKICRNATTDTIVKCPAAPWSGSLRSVAFIVEQPKQLPPLQYPLDEYGKPDPTRRKGRPSPCSDVLFLHAAHDFAIEDCVIDVRGAGYAWGPNCLTGLIGNPLVRRGIGDPAKWASIERGSIVRNVFLAAARGQRGASGSGGSGAITIAGVAASGAKPVGVEDLLIAWNTIHGTADDAVALLLSSRCVVRGNEVSAIQSRIIAEACDHILIAENTVEHTAGAGYYYKLEWMPGRFYEEWIWDKQTKTGKFMLSGTDYYAALAHQGKSKWIPSTNIIFVNNKAVLPTAAPPVEYGRHVFLDLAGGQHCVATGNEFTCNSAQASALLPNLYVNGNYPTPVGPVVFSDNVLKGTHPGTIELQISKDNQQSGPLIFAGNYAARYDGFDWKGTNSYPVTTYGNVTWPTTLFPMSPAFLPEP